MGTAGEWCNRRWGDLATLEYGRALRGHDTGTGPYRVFGTNGPIGWHDSPLCNHPGVIIGRKGAYRGVHYSPTPFFVIDTAFYLEPKTELDLRWAYYELLTQDINGMDSGSAIPSTSRESFYNLPVMVPPLPEQHAITHILGTLDDKIELNRRMNETLEQMARVLFKSWFVDFLPVRAKMAAKENDPSLLLPEAQPDTWYVYAIECNDGSLYIGQTEDLRQRWLQHVSGRGADWTKHHPPVRVPFWERQPSREAAIEREQWLKTGFGRRWLKAQIAASARTQTGDPLPASAGQAGVRAKCMGVINRASTQWPQHILDLFPDSFEDSELGEIPKGWEVWRIADIGSVICGKTPPTQEPEYYGNDVPFITIPDMHGKVFATTTQKRLSRAGAASQQKKTIPAGAICVSCIATPGLVVITSEESQTNQQINTVVPHRRNESFFWFWSLRDLGHDIHASGSGGSVLTNLSTGRFSALRVLAAPAGLRSSYHIQVAPLFARILANDDESRTLAALRDTLLPKLISGELRVKDAERFVERGGA